MSFGRLLRFYRKEKGLTQEKLSEGIISVTYLSKIENEKIIPDKSIIELLAERLQVDPSIFNTTTNEHLIQLIFSCYDNIVKKNIDDAEKEYYALQESLKKEIYSQELQYFFKIIELRYMLHKEQFKDLHFLYEQITNFPASDNTKMEYIKHKTLGIYYYIKNNYRNADIEFHNAERILEMEKILISQEDKAELFYQASIVKNRISEIYDSIYLSKEALKVYQSLYNLKRSAECHVLIGANYNKLKKYDLALKAYESALVLSKKLKDKYIESMVYQNIGALKSSMNNSKEAIQNYLNSYKIKAENDMRNLYTIHSIVMEHYKNKSTEEMTDWINKGLTLSRLHNNLEYTKHFTVYDHLIKNDSTIFRFLEEDVIPFFEAVGRVEYVVRYAEILGNLYDENKKYKLASKFYNLGLKTLKNL